MRGNTAQHTPWAVTPVLLLLAVASACGSKGTNTIGRIVECDGPFESQEAHCSPGRNAPDLCSDNRQAADLGCDTEDSIGMLAHNIDGSSYCTSACRADDDCGNTGVCLCGESIGTCFLAACRTNADCLDGASCISWTEPCGQQLLRFACSTDQDTCHHSGHCPDGTSCSAESGSFRCEPVPAPCYVQ